MTHKLEIRQRPGTENLISTGGNTIVLLDGRPLAASFIKIEANARKVTKVLLEIYASVEADLLVDLEEADRHLDKTTLKSK